ncbi:DUF1643 domain-containing protein [Tsuneonella sp. HG222]
MSAAVLSPCGRYRLRLDRSIGGLFGSGPTVALIGVNPSTADATENDATIRKNMGFASRLGWSRIIKANKFAWRATDVRELATVFDPIGPMNDQHLFEIFAEADILVPCWGPLAKLPPHLRGRWLEVAQIMLESGKPIMCFGTANDGQPRHTLMLPYTTPLSPWRIP